MKTKNALILFLTAFIWGTAFVAQIVGMDYMGPFGFNGIRSVIGGIALLPCIFLLDKLGLSSKGTGSRKDLITGGIACGVLLFAASSLQQIGIQYTSAGKAGFITAIWDIFKKENRLEGLGGSGDGSCRTLFPLHYGIL